MNKQQKWIKECYEDGASDGENTGGGYGCRCFRNEECGDTPTKGCQLNVTRDGDAILYNCFSAKCPLGGGVVSDGGHRNRRENRQSVSASVKTYIVPGNAIPIIPQDARDWLKKFDLTPEEYPKFNITYNTGNGKICFPVRVNGSEQGYIERNFRDNNPPKWWKNTQEGAFYEAPGTTEVAILMESAISAIRINKYTNHHGIAILGHGMPEKKLLQLREYVIRNNIKKLVLWLDPDVPRNKIKKLKRVLTSRVCCDTIVLATEDKPHSLNRERVIECLK